MISNPGQPFVCYLGWHGDTKESVYTLLSKLMSNKGRTAARAASKTI